MRKLAIVLMLMTGAGLAQAAETEAALDRVRIDLDNTASLQRGAGLFVNYCLSCHSAQAMRYNRMGRDLGITDALLKSNVLWASDKVGDRMTVTMPAGKAEQWFGVAPPDLSTIARLRKPEWLYTYLRSFYVDEQAPTGWNNAVFQNVAMPNVLHELQGVQRPALDEAGKVAGLELAQPGTLSSSEFDAAMRDLTAFLVYLSEPAKLERYGIGFWVLAFLVVLAVLSYLLKKEYWRDVH